MSRSDFNEEQQELLSGCDRWRLVVRNGEAAGGTVEVAHEALFRTWERLQSWLEPERARLEALRALQVDAANWERNGQDKGFLNHREEWLAEARNLSNSAGYARRLIKRDFARPAAPHEHARKPHMARASFGVTRSTRCPTGSRSLHADVTEPGGAELTERGVMALSGRLTPQAARLYLNRTEKQREAGLLKRRARIQAVTSVGRRRSRQRRPQRSHPMLLNLQRHQRPALRPAAGRLTKLRCLATA